MFDFNINKPYIIVNKEIKDTSNYSSLAPGHDILVGYEGNNNFLIVTNTLFLLYSQNECAIIPFSKINRIDISPKDNQIYIYHGQPFPTIIEIINFPNMVDFISIIDKKL